MIPLVVVYQTAPFSVDDGVALRHVAYRCGITHCAELRRRWNLLGQPVEDLPLEPQRLVQFRADDHLVV
jgi:hypothetical protein